MMAVPSKAIKRPFVSFGFSFSPRKRMAITMVKMGLLDSRMEASIAEV